MSLYSTNPAYWWELSNQDGSYTGQFNSLSFNERSATATVSRLFLGSGGFIGVTTTTPKAKVHLAGVTTQAAAGFDPSLSWDSTLYLQDTSGGGGTGPSLVYGTAFGDIGAIKGYLNSSSGPLGTLVVSMRTSAANAPYTQVLSIPYTGACTISGTLTVSGGKPFEIADPRRPATHGIRHAAIESPSLSNIYPGRVTLTGDTVIDIDAACNMDAVTFRAVNREESAIVMCAAQGGAAITWTTVSDGKFTISGAEGADVSWYVFATRHDPDVRKPFNTLTDDDGNLIVNFEYPHATDDERAAAFAPQTKTIAVDHPADARIEEDTEAFSDLDGKYGFPRHPERYGMTRPTRTVIREYVYRERMTKDVAPQERNLA
jgi:hypothetical protein